MMRLALLFLGASICCFSQPAKARAWADHWAREFGVDRELVYAVIEVESAWNPRAVSAKGAVGLMQLMPETAAEFGVRDRFDPADNIRGGVAYLAWLKKMCGGDRRLVAASYFAGQNRVLPQGLQFSSEEVFRYVRTVAQHYRRYRWKTLNREHRRTD
jgi:soluble lytic murein transglycosylase-like protein